MSFIIAVVVGVLVLIASAAFAVAIGAAKDESGAVVVFAVASYIGLFMLWAMLFQISSRLNKIHEVLFQLDDQPLKKILGEMKTIASLPGPSSSHKVPHENTATVPLPDESTAKDA